MISFVWKGWLLVQSNLLEWATFSLLLLEWCFVSVNYGCSTVGRFCAVCVFVYFAGFLLRSRSNIFDRFRFSKYFYFLSFSTELALFWYGQSLITLHNHELIPVAYKAAMLAPNEPKKAKYKTADNLLISQHINSCNQWRSKSVHRYFIPPRTTSIDNNRVQHTQYLCSGGASGRLCGPRLLNNSRKRLWNRLR